MKLIGGLIFRTLLNTVAILAASYFIEGFSFSGNFIELITTAFIFALIYVLVRPLLKLFLGPFIVLTFGLFIIVINAFLLYVLDIWSAPLTIDGYMPLLLATLLISVVSLVASVGAKMRFRNT